MRSKTKELGDKKKTLGKGGSGDKGNSVKEIDLEKGWGRCPIILGEGVRR